MKKLFAVAGLAICLILVPVLGSELSLQKGQVIKQFFAYSITESLTEGASFFSTRIPCGNPPRVWVEEPPIFHGIAAIGLKAFSGRPALVPILVFALLGWAVWLLSIQVQFYSRVGMTAGVLFSPALLRYSIQHLPDLLATLWLTLGAAALLRQRLRAAVLLFALAVSTKALAIFAVAPLLIGACGRQRWRYSLISLGLISLPFLLWILAIFHFEIASPFRMSNVVENRHSGGLELLLMPGYYSRFFTWVAIKGAGLALFFAAVWRTYRLYMYKGERSSLEKLLIAWGLGLIPYWLLVRQGNFVHDYYSLPFMVPIATLGVIQLLSIERAWLGRGLLVANLGIAVFGFFQMDPMELGPEQDRPSFCASENRDN